MKPRPLAPLLALLPLAFAGPAPAAETPNIVLILADDMGMGDVAHNGGKAPTPHIDRLAAEGMRFTDAHSASSVCTPTRYALLTGRYSWRSTLKKGVLGGTSTPLITRGETLLPAFLARHDYRSAAIGKWHLGLGWERLDEPREAEEGPTKGAGWRIDYTRPVDGGPLDLGFTEDFLYPASLDMAPYVYLRNDEPVTIPTVSRTFWRDRWGAADADLEAEDCLRDFAREARAFIGRKADKDDPFFLYLPLTSPHTPVAPSARWQGKSGIGDYGDFLMETDWVVGEVLAALDERHLAEDTLVFFTSDNGFAPPAGLEPLESQGHFPSGDLRGHKADIHEGGHRVPFLVRWPGVIEAGTVSDRILCQTDIFATCADAIEHGDDLEDGEAPDSISFLPTLRGATQEARPLTVHHSVNGSFAVRKDDWKLILCPGSGGWSAPRPDQAWKNDDLPRVQLYNLAGDPDESDNLQAEQPDLVENLAAELATLITNGRTTPGPELENHGDIPFHDDILKRFPVLAGE